MPQKILLLTKNYPPQIGGIEKYAFDLYSQLKEEWNNIRLIAAWPRNEWLLGKGGITESRKYHNFLPKIVTRFLWYFWKICYLMSELFRLSSFATRAVFLWILWWIKAKNNGLIWSIDGSIAWLWVFIAKIVQIKTRVTLHGTDVVWNNNIYQKIMPKFWRMTDEIFVVSKVIEHEARKRKIPWNKIFLREHSLNTMHFPSPWIFDKDVFLQSYSIPNDKIILFSLGRFIPLKGFHWFLDQIMPSLDSKFHYVLWGLWSMECQYQSIIRKKWFKNVSIIWPIREPVEKARWFCSSEYFVMPNILTGGVEWFGIVLLEAHFYGVKCIISDAVSTKIQEWDIVLAAENKKEWIKYLNSVSFSYD